MSDGTEDEARQPGTKYYLASREPAADPYAILAGWIAYAEERPFDRDAQELRKLSEAALAGMMPLREMGDLGEGG